MSSNMFDELPETLRSVKTRPLLVMRLAVPKIHVVGAAPGGVRRLAVVSGGTFEGERLSGQVLDGGNDWINVRGDGATLLDVRLALKTSDDAIIAMLIAGSGMAPPTSWRGSTEARPSLQRPTISASARCSRQPPRSTPGSTVCWRSASAIGARTVRSTACSRYSRRVPARTPKRGHQFLQQTPPSSPSGAYAPSSRGKGPTSREQRLDRESGFSSSI